MLGAGHAFVMATSDPFLGSPWKYNFCDEATGDCFLPPEAPNVCRAGEGDKRDARVLDQSVSDVRPIAAANGEDRVETVLRSRQLGTSDSSLRPEP